MKWVAKGWRFLCWCCAISVLFTILLVLFAVTGWAFSRALAPMSIPAWPMAAGIWLSSALLALAVLEMADKKEGKQKKLEDMGKEVSEDDCDP